MAQRIDLPRHVQYAALEEMLLLQALVNLVGDDQRLKPSSTLYTRNELVYAALLLLPEPQRDEFLHYADQLTSSIVTDVLVSFPMPISAPVGDSSRAERLAYDFLMEGMGSLWSAAREVARDLTFVTDKRAIASGATFRLGLYNKGGLIGLTSETKSHHSVCQLLNLLVIATLGTHRWTSLSVNLNCTTEIHKDQGNASEAFLGSLHIGLSHHAEGQLWVQDPQGQVYMEHVSEGLLRGTAHPTAATANLFHGQLHYHATMPWHSGDRLIVIAYVARQHACAIRRFGPTLEKLGFVVPDEPTAPTCNQHLDVNN